ncbi:MAG: GNAT family N-acetyltransferase [Bacteroidales bacterium]|jgi:RimJ/RimL family protein N-acetyltransferase|nr:GNAT family N-acetyltransferase [Bacteroidales bacterium]
MKFPDRYRIMPSNCYSLDGYKLIPIRYEDRLDIMHWRNEQIYHLRQKELLTEEQQDNYFKEVVNELFNEEYPSQILFSYLEGERCIGYGGLVHIDWENKNAEISFMMDTALENEYFNKHWKNYLSLLYKYAFEELNLHKIYTYAFDIRPYLYKALGDGGLSYETRLKEHVLFDEEYKDVIIHSKLNPIVLSDRDYYLREATIEDVEILFHWANDPSVRNNSFTTEAIVWENHINWVKNRFNSDETYIYILYNSKLERPLGQIRIDCLTEDKAWYIGYSVDKLYRRQGLGLKMLDLIKEKQHGQKLRAKVKPDNLSSSKAFLKSNFKELSRDKECILYGY